MNSRLEDDKKELDGLHFVQSVQKAFAVLEAFNADRGDLGLSDIIEKTGLNKSSVQRFTHTLHMLGYLVKDPATRRYMLSQRVLEMANNFLRVDPLVNKAMPHIIELRRRLDMRVGLGCMDNGDVMYLIPLQSNSAAYTSTGNPGYKVAAYSTTTGRVLLAHLDPDKARSIVEHSNRRKITPMTKTDVEEIMQEIDMVRRQGYCITKQETDMGNINIAAPVFDKRGGAIAAIAAIGSIGAWTESRLHTEVAPKVLEAARAISNEIEHALKF